MRFPQSLVVSREAIDVWPVDSSGLNARVVNCLAEAGVRTVGELRDWSDERLLELQHFGVASLQNVRWFFRWTKQMEDGAAELADFRALLKEFFNRQEIFVIEQRYGLTDPGFRPDSKRRTLQTVANKLGGITRERVRQVEEEVLRVLRTELGRELTRSLGLHWCKRIEDLGGVVTSPELASWVGDSFLGGYQPWGVLMLLSDTTENIQRHFNYFSTLTAKALGRLEAEISELLQQTRGRVPFDVLRQRLAPGVVDPNRQLERLLTVILENHPDISATRDRHYFHPTTGTALVLAELLRREGRPMHFHELTSRYNDLLLPACRRGTGYILRTLTLMPAVERVDRAVYQLRAAALA